MPTSPIFDPMLRTARILWGALVGSTVLFSVLVVVMPGNGQVAPSIFDPTFVAMALATAVVSFVLPARAIATAVRGAKEQELVPGPPDPTTGRVTVTFADPKTAARSAFAAAFTPFILGMALSEAITLDGFALHMVGGPTGFALPIALLGVVLAALRFPTVGRMVAPYEKRYGATFGDAAQG